MTSATREIPFAFLQRLADDFMGSMGALRAGSQSAAAGPLSLNLNRSFGPKLKQHCEYCNANPEELSRVAACQQKVRGMSSGRQKNDARRGWDVGLEVSSLCVCCLHPGGRRARHHGGEH